MATATAEEAKKYAVAGGIAEEVLSSIRTVHAFNAQPFEMKRLATCAVYLGALRNLRIRDSAALPEWEEKEVEKSKYCEGLCFERGCR